MVVQNDERRYAWMDEGLNSFMEHYGTVEKYPEMMAQVKKGRSVVPYMLSENHQPLMTHPEEILDLGANAYDKAALSLITLREDILGPEKFDFAFKEYIEVWKHKHPQPSDFFRTMENVAGEDLSWFWRGWYYTTALLDQSIDTVMQNDSLGKYYLQIELRNLRTMVMPVKMELTFEDGSKARKDLPVEIWFKGNRFLSGFFIPKKVKTILLDPESKFPDINPTNNLWNAKVKNTP
jgi:aminopeptidase N